MVLTRKKKCTASFEFFKFFHLEQNPGWADRLAIKTSFSPRTEMYMRYQALCHIKYIGYLNSPTYHQLGLGAVTKVRSLPSSQASPPPLWRIPWVGVGWTGRLATSSVVVTLRGVVHPLEHSFACGGMSRVSVRCRPSSAERSCSLDWSGAPLTGEFPTSEWQ